MGGRGRVPEKALTGNRKPDIDFNHNRFFQDGTVNEAGI